MFRLFNTAFHPEGLAPATREALLELGFHHASEANAPSEAMPPISHAEASAVIEFWRNAGQGEWFAQRPEFDRQFRDCFLPLHEKAVRANWREASTPEGSLALLLLLDQFPRNAFRGTPRMYATDTTARDVAKTALAAQHDHAVDEELRPFFYLPFAHSEDLADQDRSVALCGTLKEPAPSHARRHRDIIRRFGRFPHRNPILGRAMTPAEQRFLDEGGYAG